MINKFRGLLPPNNTATNHMIDWMILANREQQTIECKTLDEAIHIRQKLYGLRKRIVNTREFSRIDEIKDIQIRITQIDGSSIKMNAKDFKDRKERGDFNPCLLIGERYGESFQSIFRDALSQSAKQGLLPSQIAEEEGREMERELIEKMQNDATPDSNPGFMRGMEMLRRGPPKPDEEEK